MDNSQQIVSNLEFVLYLLESILCVVFGIALSAAALFVFRLFRKQNNKESQKQQDIIISPNSLNSSIDTFKNVNKSITILNDYTNKVKEIMDGKQNEKDNQDR